MYQPAWGARSPELAKLEADLHGPGKAGVRPATGKKQDMPERPDEKPDGPEPHANMHTANAPLAVYGRSAKIMGQQKEQRPE